MKLGEAASSDEVVACMLKAEIDANPWADHIHAGLRLFGWSENLVRTPDTSNARENLRRAKLLASYRGWGRNHYLFAGFPSDVRWCRATLDEADVASVRYIRQDGWNSLSVVDGADAVKAGAMLATPQSTEKIKAIAAVIESGTFESRDPLVIVAERHTGPFTLLDGHHRATAIALARLGPDDQVPALLGVSASMADWPFWPAP